jgi:hypothetical protein
MTDLRQRRFFGTVRDGMLTVERDDGSLEPSAKGPLAQLRVLSDLGRRARRNRERLATWPAPDRCSIPGHLKYEVDDA